MTFLLGAALAGACRAQAHGGRPLTIFVAYPPGGPADLMARTVGEIISERTGQPVVVESRPGAGGQIAASAALQAPADGHTLLLGDTATLGTNRVLYRNFRYDPLVDFEAIAPLLLMPMVLFVPAASRYGSLAELVAASKTTSLNFASQGGGSTGHLLGEMLRTATGGRLNHVPYKGSAPAMADLLGGHVDLLFDGIGAGLPHLAGQRLRALAVAGPQRLAQLPGVPTTAEAGLAGVALSIWFGMVARAGTAAPVVDRLNREVAQAMTHPGAARRFADLGFQSMAMNPDEFRGFIRSESDKWSAFIRERGIALD